MMIPILIIGVKHEEFRLQPIKKLNFYKSAFSLTSQPLWFYGVKYMRMTEAVAISFTTPIISAILAVFFLKDKMTKDKWIGLGLGMVGVYIIQNPQMGEFTIYSFLVLGSSFLWSCDNIVIKELTNKRQNAISVHFHNDLIIGLLTLPLAIMYWKPLEISDLVALLVLSALGTAASLLRTAAYARSPLSELMPFGYSRLLFASIVAFFAFGEVIDMPTIIGSFVIFAGAIYTFRHAVNKKENEKKAILKREETQKPTTEV
jgi:drug/metabolite transporter (DMT)-like permease